MRTFRALKLIALTLSILDCRISMHVTAGLDRSSWRRAGLDLFLLSNCNPCASVKIGKEVSRVTPVE
jgi:hypothetical protein